MVDIQVDASSIVRVNHCTSKFTTYSLSFDDLCKTFAISMRDLLQAMQKRLDAAEVQAAGSNEKLAIFVVEAEDLRSQVEAAVKKTVRRSDFTGQHLLDGSWPLA